jgi:hypothetical protein
VRLLLLLALLLPSAPPTRPIHIIFVQPEGEQFTNEERVTAARAIADAALFWSAYADFEILSAQSITVTGDVYHDLVWSNAYLSEGNTGMTVFVIDNSNSRLSMDGAAGAAQDYYGAVYVLLYGYPGEHALAATLAHEMGHVQWGLPDLPWGRDDIMSIPPTMAYSHGFIGCGSLEQLGAPCRRLWLPLVTPAQLPFAQTAPSHT